MKKLEYQELLNILKKHDVDFYDGPAQAAIDNTNLAAELKQYINNNKISKKAVLGIDIYRYGSMKRGAQNLVPFVAQILRDRAIEICIKQESIFEGKDKTYFQENFINTGDGGYFILDTPIHALVFAIYFEMVVRLFNSYRLYPQLRKILDQRAILRYAMTYDKVYKYENNHYGAGIITNARILGKDKLDRFLIAENVYDWFMRNTNGIDNLQIFAMEDIKNIEEFQHLKTLKTLKSDIFPSGPSFHATAGTTVYNHDRYNRLNSIDVQKIGEIESKNQEKLISIYNLHIQYSGILQKPVQPEEFNNNPKIKVTVSLGNLNVSGISD